MKRTVLFIIVLVISLGGGVLAWGQTSVTPEQTTEPPQRTTSPQTDQNDKTTSGRTADASQRNGAQDANDPAVTLKVNVKLVNVFATVTDSSGAPIASLKRDDFKLYEDGVQQNIAVFNRESELPLSIVMGIDCSLSTRKDLKLELESARRFARAILRPIDGLALYSFSEVVDEVVPFTADLQAIDRGVNRIQSRSATALYDALYLGSEALNKRRGRKVMVVITDGGDTASKVNYADAVRATQIAEAIVYSIIMVPIEASAGRDTGGEHALIQLSQDTGGKYYYATSLNQLDSAFAQISNELRTQYLLAYYPSKRLGDEFRHIEIKIDPSTIDAPNPADLTVRHRSGYFTSKFN
jgi:Ca-activated chloride channel homolog